MRHLRSVLFALVAANAVGCAASAAPAQPQPFRKLEFSRVGPWEVAAIGNDEKVNHCALIHATSSADLKPGEPQFMMVVDDKLAFLRVRASEYRFTERKALAVTTATAEGVEDKPLAATGGPDIADIRLNGEAKARDALFATAWLDIRTEGASVRLSFAGLADAKPAIDQCLANIGSPANGWSNAEIDQLIEQVKRGTAVCRENKATGVMTCDAD